MKAIAFLFFSGMLYWTNHLLFPASIIREEQKWDDAGLSKIIVWDTTTLKRVAPPDSAAFYPRMLQLKNGNLLVVYTANGNVAVVRSTDGGQNWSSPRVIAARKNGVNMDTPDLLQLQNGTLLVCYATRPQAGMQGNPDTTKRYEIRIQKSSDEGNTWQNEKILYQAGASFKDGCWEPDAIELPSGEIQLFFSDEAIYTRSDEQNISVLRSFDNGVNWPATPQIISFRNGSRDGMPVPIWLKKDKKVVVAIEDQGHKNFKPYTIHSSANGEWQKITGGEDKERTYALHYPVADSIYAGAPYLRQLSTGETILSYQSTEGRIKNRDNNAIMRVAIGDNEAKNFDSVTTPFQVPEGCHALWNSLCILKGDTIVAVTSTNGYSKKRSEIWIVKGVIQKQ